MFSMKYGFSKLVTPGVSRLQAKIPQDTTHIRSLPSRVLLVTSFLFLGFMASPAAVADGFHGVAHRIAVLQAKEDIRSTLHAFVRALNSSFLTGETNPLAAVAPALHPEVVLSATPPPTPLDPVPEPIVFAGINQVIGGYGQMVVVATKPNILPSDIDVRILSKTSAEADLRFANAVNFPSGCMLGSPGCAKVLLFADVYVSFERRRRGPWQATNIDLVHHIATGGPPGMMP